MDSKAMLQRAGLAVLMALLALAPLPALADLMLNPTRIVFTKNQRAAQLELINNGREAATYRISLVNRRMTETGEFLDIQTAAEGEQFAAGMLHYSPRQVTLLPGTAQVVRVMLRKPDQLAPGEYRSHLHFEKLAAPGGVASIESQARGQQQIGVVLNTLIGASIPVIVRHETNGATLALTELALQAAPDGAAQLAFRIERGGDTSVYGDLSATFTTREGAEHSLGKATGLAVYVPNPLRRARLTLNPPKGVLLAQGLLRLRFRERPEAGAKLLAEATLTLP